MKKMVLVALASILTTATAHADIPFMCKDRSGNFLTSGLIREKEGRLVASSFRVVGQEFFDVNKTSVTLGSPTVVKGPGVYLALVRGLSYYEINGRSGDMICQF